MKKNSREIAGKAAMGALNSIMDDEDEDEYIRLALKAIELAGSSSSTPRTRVHRAPKAYIRREREEAAQRLYRDYFADPPVFLPHQFKRRFRMRCQLFLRIVEGITNASLTSDLPYFKYFKERPDACQRDSFTVLQKCTAALRQLAYGTSGDMWDEYLHMGESTALLCLDNFCMCVFSLYSTTYLRKPTAADIARIYAAHEERHGFPGMLGSIDCMHWAWKNCPVGWQGQFGRGDKPGPSVMLEAVASQDLWIWHAFFGMAGSNNDINVLNYSPLFNTIKDGTAPPSPFDVNGHHYERGYYLGDGIYPNWAMLVKAPSAPTDEKRQKFKRFQESARKDIERAFGVLQGRFAILKTPARSWDLSKLTRQMYCCVILHNMIVEDNEFAIGSTEEEFLADNTNTPRRQPMDFRGSDIRAREIRDQGVHNRLEKDLTEHIWRLPPNFRHVNQ